MISNVEITSKEMIKPSSPTPPHLKNIKLSFLDQMAPPIYEPMIFFYEAQKLPVYQMAPLKLKQSLSDVLTQYYPLAGRFLKDKFTIDCNDSGALFVQCKIQANLSEVIRDPTMDDLEKLLPLGPVCMADAADTTLLAVQINLFNCGGIAVVVEIHHSFADAISLVSFANAWAAVSRGSEIPSPKFDMATFFPPKDMSTSGYQTSTGIATENIVTKRYVFDKERLEEMRTAEMESSELIKDPSRVEALSSFIFRHLKAVSRGKGSEEPLGVVHAVNLRPKMDPPQPNHAFGNAARPVVAILPVDDSKQDVVSELRNAIKKVDEDYVKELQLGDEHLNSFKNLAGLYLNGEIELFYFTSVCRLPVYEVDYGWGRPIWVSPTTFPYKNLVIFMNTSSGDGIEAWVNLLEEDAASFQQLVMPMLG